MGEIEAGEHKETKSNTQACHQWRAWDASPPWGGSAKSQMLLWHQYLEVLRKELGPDAAAAAAACMSTEGRKRTRKQQTSKCTIALMHVAALFFEDLVQHWYCLCSCLV